jgi:ABC-type transporter Mla maintaining outer membrane lipid asymmetry ATPase subunit MlaF
MSIRHQSNRIEIKDFYEKRGDNHVLDGFNMTLNEGKSGDL